MTTFAGAETRSWNALITPIGASHESAPIQPHVLLLEGPSGDLSFDVVAAPLDCNTDWTDPSVAVAAVQPAYVYNDKAQGHDPYRVIVCREGETRIGIDPATAKAVQQFWKEENMVDARYADMGGAAGMIGFASVSGGRREYGMNGFNFVVTDQGLAVASLRAAISRSLTLAGPPVA